MYTILLEKGEFISGVKMHTILIEGGIYLISGVKVYTILVEREVSSFQGLKCKQY